MSRFARGIISNSLWQLENSTTKLQCVYSDPMVLFRVFRLFASEVLVSLQLADIAALRWQHLSFIKLEFHKKLKAPRKRTKRLIINCHISKKISIFGDICRPRFTKQTSQSLINFKINYKQIIVCLYFSALKTQSIWSMIFINAGESK